MAEKVSESLTDERDRPQSFSTVEDRPQSLSIVSDVEVGGQPLTCHASRDGARCNLCKSLISFSSGSQISDSQRLSLNIKREASTCSNNAAPIMLRDLSVTPVTSRGNTPKTLCSLTEEATTLPLKDLEDGDRTDNTKIIIKRDKTKEGVICFATDFPAECCFLKRVTFSEEDWLSFIQKVNELCAKIELPLEPVRKPSAFLHCCITSDLERQERTLRNFINKSNKKVFNPCGLHVNNVAENSYETLEIVVRDCYTNGSCLKCGRGDVRLAK